MNRRLPRFGWLLACAASVAAVGWAMAVDFLRHWPQKIRTRRSNG